MLPRLKPVLAIDAAAAIIGGAAGASSATSYIESAAGVAEGARTGLHTVFVGLLFLASMLFAPLAAAVPAVATAPALILTGFADVPRRSAASTSRRWTRRSRRCRRSSWCR